MGRGSGRDKAAISGVILRRAKGADRLWLTGFNAFVKDRWDIAEESFLEATHNDEGLADAWLGLHALRPNSFYYLSQIFNNLHRLGETQKKLKCSLESSYAPAWFKNQPLSRADDVRRAYAHALAERGDFKRAEEVLSKCKPAEATSATTLKVAFLAQDYKRCMEIYQKTSWGEEMDYDAKILSAIAMSRLSVNKPAIASLKEAVKTAPIPEIQRVVRYQLALAYERAGQARQARQELEMIAAEDADFLDVADRLGFGETVKPEPDKFEEDTLVQPPRQDKSEQITEKMTPEEPSTPLSEKPSLPWNDDQKSSAETAGFEGIDFDSLSE